MHRVIRPDNLKHGVTAFFTGKVPGSDIGEIAAVSGMRKSRIYMPMQKHTDTVQILDASLEPRIADAVVVREKGLLIGVRVADCVPILLYDRVMRIAGAVHAGWRGTASSILKKTINVMQQSFSSDPANIAVAIGPSIRGCCYVVGPEVSEAVSAASEGEIYHRTREGKHCIDLASANRHQALAAGIPEANIWMSDECTFCNPDRFFSYRYAKGCGGRQAAFIGMRCGEKIDR
jgi:YfiH family protein